MRILRGGSSVKAPGRGGRLRRAIIMVADVYKRGVLSKEHLNYYVEGGWC